MKKVLIFLFVMLVPSFLYSNISYVKKSTGVIHLLNKTTGKYEEASIRVGRTYQFDDLVIFLRACNSSSASDDPENVAFIQVAEIGELDQNINVVLPDDFREVISEIAEDRDSSFIFSGWIFSSSPSVSYVNSSTYDVDLIICK